VPITELIGAACGPGLPELCVVDVGVMACTAAAAQSSTIHVMAPSAAVGVRLTVRDDPVEIAVLPIPAELRQIATVIVAWSDPELLVELNVPDELAVATAAQHPPAESVPVLWCSCNAAPNEMPLPVVVGGLP